MSNNKQSSVEWLENEFVSLYFDYLTGLIDNKEYNERHKLIIEQSKSMHREEIIQAWKNGDGKFDKTANEFSLKYYNEKFTDNQ